MPDEFVAEAQADVAAALGKLKNKRDREENKTEGAPAVETVQ